MSYKISTVSTGRLDNSAVSSAKIADDAISSAKIADDAVAAAAIAADSVGASELADNAVDTAAIADSAVATAKIADDAITAAKLADNLVYGSNLTVSGNLTVNGATTTINSTTLEIDDKQIVIAKENSGSAPLGASGVVFDGGSGNDLQLVLDASGTKLEWKDSASAYKTIKADTFEGALSGNASTATALATARTIALAGDLSGSAAFDGSGNISISATIGADSVALGTDTTGNYMSGISGSGAGVSVSHTAGEGSSATVSLHASLQDVAGLSHGDGAFIVSDGSNFTAESGATARASLGLGTAAVAASGDFFAASSVSTFGASLVDDADAAAARATLGLVLGTDVQQYDAQLASLSNLSNPTSGDTFVTMNPGGFANNVLIGDFSNASSGVVRESVGADDATGNVSLTTFQAYTRIDMANRSSCTVTLPTITSSDTGKKMTIKAGSAVASGKPVTVQGNSQDIDGGTFTLNEAYQALTVVAMSSGSGYEWFIV